MGTSKGYRPPTRGPWPPLKRLATQFAGEGGENGDPPSPDPRRPTPRGPSPEQLLGRYVAALRSGGSSGTAGGTGNGGGGTGGRSRQVIGRSASRVGRNLGRFASRVNEVGLTRALEEIDLGDLIGRPASEVVIALIDRLAGPGSAMDAHLARKALNRLQRELLGDAQTFEEVEQALATAVQGGQISSLVIRFYGFYLFELFTRDFYEQFRGRHGKEKATRAMESIRHTIFRSLRAKLGQRDAARFNWRGAEGRQLAERILNETLTIFEGYA